MSRLPVLLLLAVALLLPAAPSEAQIRGSEPATFTQTIDGTVFRMEYYRPRVRDRAPLFGPDAVVWEHTWTPGANWGTKLAFQKDIEFEGVSIPAGTYSLWIDLDEDTWMPKEFFFEPDTLIFHTLGPVPAPDQIRFPVALEDAPFKDVLTWAFEDISSTGGVLALRWGTHRIAFDITVEPSMSVFTEPEAATPVVGMWEAQFAGPNGQMSPPFSIRVFHTDDGVLHADWEGVPAQGGGGLDPFFNDLDMWLLPSGAEGIFVPGEAYDGELRETWAGNTMEFDPIDGMSATFEVRNEFDELFLKGRRVN